jgi:hypothetical protein
MNENNKYNKRVGDQINNSMTVFENMFTRKLEASNKEREDRFDKFEKKNVKQLDEIVKMIKGLTATVELQGQSLSKLTNRFDGNTKDGEKTIPARMGTVEDGLEAHKIQYKNDKAKIIAWTSGIATTLGIVIEIARNWWSNR